MIKHLTMLATVLSFLPMAAWSAGSPPCISRGQVLQINNETVLKWKHSLPAGMKRQAHVEGVIVRDFADRASHEHFEINIGTNGDDVLEVVYNRGFGPLPEIRVGMRVEACGEYITSDRPNNGYAPSPSGAIIHWVHRSDNVNSHDSGFLVIDGTVCGYGQVMQPGGPRPFPRKIPRRPRQFDLQAMLEPLDFAAALQ